jgi:protein SCO1/2
MIATPKGRLSRYLYGVVYSPPTLRLALVEAGQGKIGTTLDQVLLFCFHYDAASGSYAPAAMRVMQIGGCLTFTALLLGVVPFWMRNTKSTSNVRNQDLETSTGPPKVPPVAEAPEPLVAR